MSLALTVCVHATPPPAPVCKAFCEDKTQAWDDKCTWGGCNGCTECFVPEPECKPFCEDKTQAWDDKCTWRGCNGCTECSSTAPTALAEDTAGVRRYTLVAKYSTFNADGAVLRKPLFNGSLPGPLLYAFVNETLEITVVNAMTTDGLTLRTQPFAPEAQYDGTPGVSQVPIGPNGGSMVYKFNFNAPGTAHYHSGVGFQRETLFGPIVVHATTDNEPFDYDYEATIKSNDGTGAESPVVMFSDLYHVSTNELEAQLDNNIGDWIWAPQSSLVNGHGKYNCTTKHPYYFRCTWQCPVTDALCIDEVRCHGTAWGKEKDYLWEDNGHPGATWLAFNASHPQLVAANQDAWNERCKADHLLPWMQYSHAAAGDFTELTDIGGSKFAVVDGKPVTPPGDEVHQSQFLNWGRPTGTLCNVSAATRDTRCAPDGTWRFKGINRDRIYDHLRNDDGSYDVNHYDAEDLASHGATCRATKFYSGSVQPEGNHNPFGLWSQSRAQCNNHAQKSNNAVGYPVMEVEFGKTYRVRLVNMATLLYNRVVFEGHTMTLVEVDGEYVEPVELNFLDLWNGQTYSVLVTADKSPRDYWVGAQTGHRGFTRFATHFVLRYVGNTDRLPNPSRPPPQASKGAKRRILLAERVGARGDPKGAAQAPVRQDPKCQHPRLFPRLHGPGRVYEAANGNSPPRGRQPVRRLALGHGGPCYDDSRAHVDRRLDELGQLRRSPLGQMPRRLRRRRCPWHVLASLLVRPWPRVAGSVLQV